MEALDPESSKSSTDQEQGSFARAVSSLKEPGFRVFLLGQAAALQGTWVQGTAQRWLVLELTDSTFLVGVLGAVAGLPILLFALAGGLIADRLPRITFLIIVQSVIALQALVFGLLVQTGSIEFWSVLALAFILGSGISFEVPARQALLFNLVGRSRITNGIALHSTAFNLARFGGPALAGFMIQAGFMAGCFYFKAASALCVIASLIYVLRRYSSFNRPLERKEGSILSDIKEVVGFVRGHRLLSRILPLITCFGIFLLPYSMLLAPLGRDVLGLNARDYGLLCAANGLGALIGALFVAARGHVGNRVSWWWRGAAAFPASIILLSLGKGFWDSSALLFISGFIMVTASTSAMSLLQIETPDHLRGRIMGLFSTCFMGLFPLGSLLNGFLGQNLGIRQTFFITGSIGLAAALVGLFSYRGSKVGAA